MSDFFSESIENEYLKKIISQQKDIFFQFTLSPDNTISFDYLNGVVYEIKDYIYTLEQVKGNSTLIFGEIIHPEDVENFIESICKCFHSLERLEIECRIILNNLVAKWIRVSAKSEKLINGSVSFYGTKSDITNIKLKEEDYKISEARSQFANLASNIGVWDWNMVTNKVFYSAQSLKILELEESDYDLISNPEKWDERVHPDDKEVYFGNIKLHFENKIPFYETYHRVLCKNKYKWILDRGKVISRDASGKPLRIIGTHSDVSSQKERELKLQETLDLVNNQKNKLLNFAYIVGHNLRNHTGNLTTLLEMKESSMMSFEELMPYIKIISNELNTTIENLVELINVQSNLHIDIKELVVTDYLNTIFIVLADDIIKNDIKVINKVPKNFKVNFIPAYLESVLLNLTTNAIKYSDSSKEPYVEYYVDYENEMPVLCVKDNGLGIDMEKYKDVIFGLYKTFHKHENSTGIGLHITKNQIEAMNGKIEVESKVNEGSTFKIYFSI
jgi:PAS domain-containing protein/two-component sensor histidine kinase